MLSIDDATSRIRSRARSLDIRGLGSTQQTVISPFGTSAFCSHVSDGKGILYCHASGPLSGKVFYARGGIGWYYKTHLNGTASFLGLPVTDELPLANGNRRSEFEGGYIEWQPNPSKLFVYLGTGGTSRLVDQHTF